MAQPLEDRSPVGRRPFGLRAGLYFMLAIGLLPALAGTAWYLRDLRDTALSDAFRQADLVAIATAEGLRWQMEDARAMMAAIAERARVRALDPAQCDSVFRDFRDLNPSHKALSLRRLDGSSVCSELERPPSRDSVASSPWFQAAIRQADFHASDGHLGNVQRAWTARLTYPVRGASGAIEGLLITPIDLDRTRQRLFSKLPESAVVAVVDSSDKVVLRSQLHEERVGKVAAGGVVRFLAEMREERLARGGEPPAARRFAEVGIDGERRLFAVRAVPATDWSVVSALSESGTLQPYYESRNRALAAVLAVLLLVALSAWRVSRSVLVPIKGLADAARGVGSGDRSRRAPEAGPREIREVAREFNRMVEATTEASEKLHASESHYRTLIENLPVAVVSHRADSAIEVFNERACMMLRMTPDEMEGRLAADRVWYFVDAQGRRIQPPAYPVNRVLQTKQPMLPELLGIVSDDSDGQRDSEPLPHTWVLVTAYPQFNELQLLDRVIVVFVDVTAQRQSEELRVAKESAEAASRAKSVFLSRVSHELRTPLNAINGFSELMLADPQVPLPVKDKLRHVFNAGRHLLSLINQVLDLTRIESGQAATRIRPVRLGPLLEECVAICGPISQARGVAIEIDRRTAEGLDVDALWVAGDDTHLRQIFMNLLSNAVKYNRPDGRVNITVGSSTGADGRASVTVKVRDTGHGLGPAQVGGLFQPFNRLGAEHSGIEGHGLGLSISRLLAQLMSGDITATSVVGEGTCFEVRLVGAAAPEAP